MPKKREEDIRDVARRNKAYADTRNDDGIQLAAFMATFHPEHPEAEVREMMREARREQRKRR